jgi:hypothetical protein
MFNFVTRYLGFLKSVPVMGWLFDGLLKLWVFFTKPALLDWMDEIEAEVLRWQHTTSIIHKYGGMQFNYKGREIGHIHSNGLLDMLLSRSIKAELMQDGRISDHHIFKNTGWVSFYMRSVNDRDFALELLRKGYENLVK